MVHRLADPSRPGAVMRPMTASLRYRCACGDREVLSIAVVLDIEAPEEVFLLTMRDLLRDMKTEVAQHLRETD